MLIDRMRCTLRRRARGRPDSLLDEFMPLYEVREYHETRVAAPAELTLQVARELDMQDSGLIRAIFKGREILMGADSGERRQPQSFLPRCWPWAGGYWPKSRAGKS